MKKPMTPESARLRMADLCARSEQCEQDIRMKLYKGGLSAADAEDVVRFLKSGGFLDNARYARSYVRDKFRLSLWGKQKIRVALMAKRISSADIAAALGEISAHDYKAAVMKLAASKAAGLDLNGENAQKERAKLYRFIVSRGYESALALQAVKRQIKAQQDD